MSEELQCPVPGVRALREDNPGPMTLDGTVTYLIASEHGNIVVDPGEDDPEHQQAIAAAGPVSLILLTHRHADHVGGLPRLRELTGAPSRALSQDFTHGAPALHDGERLALFGEGASQRGPVASLRVMATPGHTSDSMSLVLEDEQGRPLGVLTGDTILGRGTTILDFPDGTLGDYLASLERLAELDEAPALPAHGGFPGAVGQLAQTYLEHRRSRLQQVRHAVAELRRQRRTVDVAAVTDVVYADVDPAVRGAAERTVEAQLQLVLAED